MSVQQDVFHLRPHFVCEKWMTGAENKEEMSSDLRDDMNQKMLAWSPVNFVVHTVGRNSPLSFLIIFINPDLKEK